VTGSSTSSRKCPLPSFRLIAPLNEKRTAHLAKKLTFATPRPDTEFSRLKLNIANLLFLRVLFNHSVACDRF
jgi:hypothetical protein